MAIKLLFVLGALVAVVNAEIAVLHSRASNLPQAQNLTARLNAHVPARRFAIENREGLLRVVSQNPNVRLLVMLSSTAAEDYAQIIREGRNALPPHVTVIDEAMRDDDITLLSRLGVMVSPAVDPALAIRGIGNKYGIKIQSVGYIHCDAFRNAAVNEIAQLRSTEITPAVRRLRIPILQDEFAHGIGRFYSENISVYRFFGRDPLFTFLQADASMVSFVERRTTAIIVDTRDFVHIFPYTPVVVMEQNARLTEQIVALISIAAYRESEQTGRFVRPVTVRTTSATLFSNDHRGGENIIGGEDLLFRQTERILEQVRRSNAGADELWELYFSTFGRILDTAEVVERPSGLASVKTMVLQRIRRVVETPMFGYGALGVIVFMVVLKMAALGSKKRYKRRIALLMPGNVNKISFVDSDGNSVSLKILLENEGFDTALTSSLRALKRILRKKFPSVVLADWEAARTMLQTFYQDFTSTHKFSQLGIVLINIPINKQTQMKKLFGGANVFCYDDVPTLDEVLSHLRGDKHFSSYAEGSYMSGIIQEDNLTAVLQMIEGNMYTGCLVVEEDKPVSVIYFKGGRVVHAVGKGGEGGLKSIYNALNCRRGNFYFHLNRAAQTESLSLGTMEILMGWADQRDRFTQKIDAISDKK